MKAQQSLQSSLPVLPGSRLLLHVVHHSHLLLVWCKHLEASTVTAQVVHGAEDRYATYCIWTLRGSCNNRNITNTDTHYTPSWTSVPSHQPHPENTWVKMSLTDHIYIPTSLFSSSLVMTMLYLPLQYWCFPSCHNRHGEQSRRAGEPEDSGSVLTAES